MLSSTSRLETPNMMLSCLGLRPLTEQQVAQLSNPGTAQRNEVKIASNILGDVTREVQSSGWGLNTEKNYPFAPNEEGEILLPSNLHKIDNFPYTPGLIMRKRGNSPQDSLHGYHLAAHLLAH